MHPLIVSVLKAAGTVGGFAVLAYVLYRAVVVVKKSGRTAPGGEMLAVVFLGLGGAIAPAPPREATTESQELKRDEDESGDPVR